MGVIGDFTIQAESFALQHALAENPEMVVTADRVASHSTEQVLPFLWASGGDFDAFREAMADDPTVQRTTVTERAGDSVLYKVIWGREVVELINKMVNMHAAIVEAEARKDTWRLKLRFTEEGQVTSFQEHFSETGHTFEVHRLYRPTAPRQREYGLTPEQRDTLVAALREGYFEVPRAASANDLADALEISANAVSQRLRRGSANLIGNTLTITDEEE